jgi:hypothetical protein
MTRYKLEISIFEMIRSFFYKTILLLPIILLLRVYEIFVSHSLQLVNEREVEFVLKAIYSDINFFFYISGILLIVYSLLNLVSKYLADVVLTLLCVGVVVGHTLLTSYFLTFRNLLDADVYSYSLGEIKQTLGTVLTWQTILFGLIIFMSSIAVFVVVSEYVKMTRLLSYFLLLASLYTLFSFNVNVEYQGSDLYSKYLNNACQNKSSYFYKTTLYHFINSKETPDNTYVSFENAWKAGKKDIDKSFSNK